MKRTINYIIGITCSLAAVFSCARINEEDIAPDKGKMEKVVFSAVIEGGEQTKTVLGGEMGDEYRQVLWQPEDSVGICSSDWWNSTLNKFVNTETEESEVASLAGEIDNGYGTYYAFYPYSRDLYYNDYYRLFFTQPSVQNYKHNSFNANAMPMVARAGRNEQFEFYSLCGVLAVNLTGSETVKSVSFSGYDASGDPIPVAGTFEVNMGYETYPEMVSSSDYMAMGSPLSSVTLDCGEGVVLDPVNPTAFYIVLPVGTYEYFTITVNTVDDKLMLKEGTVPLNIRRANVTKAKQLAFVEEIAIDLSEHGTANSYIVSEPGLYSIKANVIGNGGYGILSGADFHTEDPFITPKSAKLIWEDRPGVVSNVTPGDNRLNFVTSGHEGNALVGVVDDAGTILWSWHIWVTDQPQEQTYVNGEDQYVMLDRNLGAVRADRGEGEQWKDAIGLAYQWGRKDPFTRRLENNYYGSDLYTTSSNRVSISEAVNNPNVFYGNGYSDWTNSSNADFWDSSQKTIYDPCPVGYVVPSNKVWAKFAKDGTYGDTHSGMNVEGSYDYGLNFIYDGANTTYYPINFAISQDAYFEDTYYNECKLWSSSEAYDNKASAFKYYYNSYVSSWLNAGQAEHYRTFAMGVRCMKDNGHVDAAKPLVKIVGTKNLTADSVTLEALVADEGSTSVIERGIIWGTTNDLSLDKGNVETAPDGGRGNYSVDIEGLIPATKYFYRAYAKNEEYTSYSDTKYFYTPYEGNVFNLSQEGTANCYIVPPVYAEYAFNATVKGNSRESVGVISTAEVLWETAMKYDDIQKGEIISEVSVDGNNVHFTLSPEVKQGNALIAVKDAEGTILWSWHIWVVDFDPVETQQTYQSGAIMMDRNLGATSVIPVPMTAENSDYTAYGLYYQWGRKDPFPYLGSIAPLSAVQTYDYTDAVEVSVQNPTTVYVSPVWIDDDMWQSSKTMYDPCPAGWRVADKSAWDGWSGGGTFGYWGDYKMAQYPYSSPTAYYPYAGCVDGWNTWPSAMNENLMVLTTDRTKDMYTHGSWDSFDFQDFTDNGRMPVRCMKEQKMESGDNEGYTGSDYDW